MQDLNITLVQAHLRWESPELNFAHLSAQLNSITTATDLIVLPEMFTTGFTMNPELLAEQHEGPGLKWMQQMAHEKSAVIVGSISVKENNSFYNRLYWVRPDGVYQYYDKRHLFRMGNEHRHYQAGQDKLIVEYKGWRICPLVCYDLRFPVWSRNIKDNAYDLLLYVANWPEVRSYPWKHLLVARAIENQSYVAGVNRVGVDGNGTPHSGDSCLLNARGEVLLSFSPHQESVKSFTLVHDELMKFRHDFPVLSDGDAFTVHP